MSTIQINALVRRATDNEKWLNEQLNRIAPHRGQIGEDADRMALEVLVFELRDKTIQRGAQ